MKGSMHGTGSKPHGAGLRQALLLVAPPMAIAGAVLAVAFVAARTLGQGSLDSTLQAALAAGAYAFTGTSRVAAGSTQAVWQMSGTGEVLGALRVAVDGPVTPDDSLARIGPVGLSSDYLIDWPRASLTGGATVPTMTLALAFPTGDPLLLVASGHAVQERGTTEVGGRTCREVGFLVAGRAYLAVLDEWPGALPVNARAGDLTRFEGEGTVWIETESELPCRAAASVELPRLAGEHPGIGWVDWTYTW